VSTGGLPQFAATSGSGCFALQLSAAQLGLNELPTGHYQIQLYGGPTLQPLGPAAEVSVSRSAGAP